MAKKALVTGGTGFVGANLVRRLLAEGHEVHLIVRQLHSRWRIEAIADAVHFHVLDLKDAEMTERLLQQVKPEWIFHLAAHGNYSWQTNMREIVDTNFLSTVNLLDAALQSGFEAFVNTGSSSEYGFKDHAPKEDEFVDPNSYYAVTKASATMFCRHLAQNNKVHVPTLRLYSVYGAYEEPNRLMPTMIVRGLSGQYPPLVNPDIARDYVYLDDALDAYMLAAQKRSDDFGAVYNVGSGVQTSIRQVAEAAKEVFQIASLPVWGSMPDRIWDTTVWVADNAKIKQELGWVVKNDFQSGFAKMTDWFRQNDEILAYYQRALRAEARS